MKIGFDLRLRGVSGLVHPVIYGHPSPLAFLGWAQALVRDAWLAGFGVPPSPKEMPDALSEVSLIIGLVTMQLRGKRVDVTDRKLVKTQWMLPVRRSVERSTDNSLAKGIGDDPRLDGHWKLALGLPGDLEEEVRGPNQDRFLAWMNAWRLSHALAGGFPEEGATQPPDVMTEEHLAAGLFKDAWLMTPPPPGDPVPDLASYVQGLSMSPYLTRNRMPTVLGYQLLEAPQPSRLGARKGLRHAFADPILGTVTWSLARQGLPHWVLNVRRDSPPYGLVLARSADALLTEASFSDEF